MEELTSIIILTYNQLKYTKLCIESIKTWTRSPYELILVDNGSTDGTVEYLKSIDNAKLITNQTNLGFGKGINQGIRAADGDYILLLNNDTIVANNWLENQLRCIKDQPEIGIVGPRTNYAGGVQGEVKGDFRNLDKIMDFSNKFNQPDPGKWFQVKEIVGFCMLIKREVIERIGLFDECFTHGMWEDNDFCRRARNKGFKLYCAGDTFVYHFGSQTILGNNLDMRQIFLMNKEKYEKKWNISNAISKTVVVLGMHRSGTSMIAGVLSKLGVNMGKNLLGKGLTNPLGHFEDQDFINLNVEILEAAGGSWDSPPARETILKQKDKFQNKIIDLVNNKPEIWGWKEPRTSLTIELYLPYLINPYFIVSYRNSQTVAESLKKRNQIRIERGLELKEIYEKRIKVFFDRFPDLSRLPLYYEEVTTDPEKWVNIIIDFLKLDVSEEERQKAVSFILPNEEVHRLAKEFEN